MAKENSTSELPGFYRLPLAERRGNVARVAELDDDDLRVVGEDGLSAEQADHMVENALGVVGVPLGLCVNLRVDGRDRLVPMAIEECSVVAAASHAAKLLRAGGGVHTEVDPPRMIGQIELTAVPDAVAAEQAVLAARAELVAMAAAADPCLIAHGGGVIDVTVRWLEPLPEDDPCGPMMVVHLVVDVREAAGANTVNAMCEHVAPRIEQLTGGRVRLRILSNLADQRLVTARGVVPLAALEGKGGRSAADLARGIEEASIFAERDPYRAATHNKGIMNGVDAVLLAFGQDWRAVEAGAHAFAVRGGRYTALSRWRVTAQGLEGTLRLPMPVGVIGGIAGVHPVVRVSQKISGVRTAAELASITGAVGLAQNLGALRALAAEGIQLGHMRAHACNVAVAAGAVGREVKEVACAIAAKRTFSADAARLALQDARARSAGRPIATEDSFRNLREQHLPAILSLIAEVLDESAADAPSLREMSRYHLDTGGKRLRAILPLFVAEALGSDPARLVPFGAACEMLHNATLVHDDLQDGDTMRRGRATVWHRFGQGAAINLGDAMFYYAVLLAQRLPVAASQREATVRRFLRETLRVIGGQERELQLRAAKHPTFADYFTMVEQKTSGLFALPLAGAAALCGLPAELVEGLQEAARHMGVLFQVQDDVLDLYGDKGREMRGSDIREGKRSLLVVHALRHAARADARWLAAVLDKPREDTTREEIARAMELLLSAGSLAFALQEMERRRDLALAVPALRLHPALLSVVEAMCELFLEPIAPVIGLAGVEACGGALTVEHAV